MNHCVPEFNMDEDYSLPSSFGLPRQKNVQEDEIMELLWQNGPVVVQTQNPRLLRKSSPPPPKLPHHHRQQEHQKQHHPPSQSAAPTPPSTSDSTGQLFMHEDEMISWLQYPLEDPPFDRDLTDLFYHPPVPSSSAAAVLWPPPPRPDIAHPHHQTPVPSRPEAPPMGLNFPHFSRMTNRFPDSGPSTSSRNNEIGESSDTPAVGQKSKAFLPRSNAVEVSGGGNRGCNSFSGGGDGAVGGGMSTTGGGCLSISMSRDGETCELTLTSSPDGSGASASATATADLMTLPPETDRKRKGREPIDDATTDYQSEDVEIESYEAKKQARRANTKRSRAAEVHNLSERKRRDRINERMKALQELIPRCSKTDKASMLDEAIEYLKSLQLQVQMMSMGCGMVPMMFPGVQQYMSSMGMGMGMGMGMTRPMMPFPAVLSSSGLPTPGAPPHINPRFPLQAFPMPHIQQTSNQGDAPVNPIGMPGHTIGRIPNLADPYQQCIGIQHMPMLIPQTQPTSHTDTSKPSTSRGDEDNEKHQSG